MLKNSVNYKILNSSMAQQVLMTVAESFQPFKASLDKAKNGEYDFNSVKLPHYLPLDGFTTLMIGIIRLNGNKLLIPYSNLFRKDHNRIEITIPPVLLDKKIKEIRIIPKANARFFEIQYTYEAEEIQRNLNINNALALDLGVNNLVTAVSTDGKTFIIDGRRLKSLNQWYNKENSRLQSIKDKQLKNPKITTKRQQMLVIKRANQINDYMSKTARMIINYCIENDIGTLVVGYNRDFQQSPKMWKKDKQNFVNIPFGKLCDKLEYLCELNGIRLVKREESYTSKASFWDKDTIPVYGNSSQPHHFSGRRVKRGLYRTAENKKLNADVNGALNILRKSNVVSCNGLYARGEVDTPIRIRVA